MLLLIIFMCKLADITCHCWHGHVCRFAKSTLRSINCLRSGWWLTLQMTNSHCSDNRLAQSSVMLISWTLWLWHQICSAVH